MDQAAGAWDINASFLRALEKQRLDARCGLSLLVSGFLMQLAGMFSPGWPAWAAAALGLLIATLIWLYQHRVGRTEEATRGARTANHVLGIGRVPS